MLHLSSHPEVVAQVRTGESPEPIVRPLQGRSVVGRSYPVAAPACGGLATGYSLAGFQPAIIYRGAELVIPHPAFSQRYGTGALNL